MRVRIKTPKIAEDERKWKVAESRSVQVTDLDTGGEMQDAIASLTIRIEPDDVVRAEANIYVSEVEVDALLSYRFRVPGSEEWKAVKRIEFEDGTMWEPGDAPERQANASDELLAEVRQVRCDIETMLQQLRRDRHASTA